MSGILFGDRVVEIAGTSMVEDTKNRLVGDLNFDANNNFLKKAHSADIKGCIYMYAAKKPVKHAVATVNGFWLSHIQLDGETYWHVESEPAFQHTPTKNAPPSDVNYRKDTIALQNGDEELAQSEKLRLEAL
ncbi:hypothetical protein PInf_024968 [Phytophthora infestans]|nr:hypothetical protein PInf_024968 [Phytophthora infestans]